MICMALIPFHSIPVGTYGAKVVHCCAQVDSISVGFALVIFLWLGFCEPHRLVYHAPVASSAIIGFMVFMATLPRLSLTRCVHALYGPMRRCQGSGQGSYLEENVV